MSHRVRRTFISRIGDHREVIVEGRSYQEAAARAAGECERLREAESAKLNDVLNRLVRHFKASKRLDPAPPQAADASE